MSRFSGILNRLRALEPIPGRIPPWPPEPHTFTFLLWDACGRPGERRSYWSMYEQQAKVSKIDGMSARLKELEDASDYVTLPDGTKFKPCSGLRLMRTAIRFKRDHQADPKLSDFSEEDQEQWRGFAKWQSPPSGLNEMVSGMAREIVGRSGK